MSRAFHATQEPTGEITVRRVNSLEGVSDIFTFKHADEMRVVLSECYEPDELRLLLHDLAKSGCVIFHAESLKSKAAEVG